MDLTTAQKDRTAYIAYSVDMDGKVDTLTDRDIYLQTYDFSTHTFTNQIKVSDLDKDIQGRADERPRLIEFKGYIFILYFRYRNSLPQSERFVGTPQNRRPIGRAW